MRRIGAELLVMAAIGAALAALGPFGSWALPLGERMALWIGCIVAGYAIFRPMQPAGRWLAEAAGIPPLAARLIVLSVGAAPLAGLVGFGVDWVGAPPGDFALRYAQAWGIGLAITLFMGRFLPQGEASAEPVAAVPAAASERPARPRLLDRLPASFGEEIRCLGVEDHYVRAHGAGGSVLVLMRLGDAIAETDGLAGMRVHRSWWVADHAVEAVEREGRSLKLRLAGGLRVPVARSYEAGVRARGWRPA